MLGIIVLLLAVALPLGIVFLTVRATEAERKGYGRSHFRQIACALARWLAIGYTAAIAIGALMCILIGSLTQYAAYTEPGCNLYDAMIYGVRCQGFFGASFVSALSNLALLALQLAAASFASPVVAPLAMVLWSPVVYFAYRGMSRLYRTSKAGRA